MMATGPTIVTGYQDDSLLREEFHKLTRATFGFDLEQWYKAGLWDNRYIPFSMLLGGRIVANVSISTLDAVIDGSRRKAIQIGTVMTHADHRDKGYASKLIDHVLEKYFSQTEAIFLIANQQASGFYLQLGFRPVAEIRFTAPMIRQPQAVKTWGNLDFRNPVVRKMVQERARKRAPVSNRFGNYGYDNLFMYHCMYHFSSNIYRDPGTDALVICKLKGRALHLYDVVASPMPDAAKLLAGCPFPNVETIVVHFTPDLLNLPGVQTEPWTEDVLFWLGNRNLPTPPFLRPKTMEA